MTPDLDQMARELKDLQYRVRALEKAHDALVFHGSREPAVVTATKAQWCPCGKDYLLCRAPECPTHKPDPLGR